MLLGISSERSSFNVLLCLLSTVPESAHAHVTPVATAYPLRYFELSQGSATSERVLISVHMHLIVGFSSHVYYALLLETVNITNTILFPFIGSKYFLKQKFCHDFLLSHFLLAKLMQST